MKETVRCNSCVGSGKVMGGGMMTKDCDECDGRGKIDKAKDDIDYLNLKNTDSYKKAIKRIKNLDKNLTDEKAEEIFEDALKHV